MGFAELLLAIVLGGLTVLYVRDHFDFSITFKRKNSRVRKNNTENSEKTEKAFKKKRDINDIIEEDELSKLNKEYSKKHKVESNIQL